MVSEIDVIPEWVPEEMGPGAVFILENAGEVGDADDPYWAVLACPECGTLGLVTRKQMRGMIPIICGSDACPASFKLEHDSTIVPIKPQ